MLKFAGSCFLLSKVSHVDYLFLLCIHGEDAIRRRFFPLFHERSERDGVKKYRPSFRVGMGVFVSSELKISHT